MTPTYRQNISLPVANKSHHCIKANCHRSLPTNHPLSYTNGLCERHFFEMNILPNDDDDDVGDKYLTLNTQLKSSSKQKKTSNQPLENDIRKTREIFDGRQW